MSAIVFPVSSAPGNPTEGAGRIVNARAVKTEQGAANPFKWPRAAGIRQVIEITNHVGCRGLRYVGSTLLDVKNERVYAITLSGTVFSSANLGALAGDDPVTIAVNNAGTPNIVAVCEAGTFNLFTGSAPTAFADGDWPSVNSVTDANGYIVGSTGGGEIWSTDLNSVSVQSDAFVSAQMPLRRVIHFRGELFAMGIDRIKVYEETGDNPFPFRYKGIEIPRGICGTHAVAGYESGSAKELAWCGEDNMPYQLNGYTPVPIGNEDVCRAIAEAADRTAIRVSVYTDVQNPIVAITSPGEWTWEYNLATKLWNERESYGRTDWRARCSVRAFDRWIVGDDETGLLGEIDPDYHREYGDALIWELISGANLAFPSGIEIPAAFFSFTAGLGSAAGEDPIETDPKVMIRISLNGGRDWGNELTRPLGEQGEGDVLVRVNRVGTTRGGRGVRYWLRVSDPVEPGFMGGDMPDVKARAA